ncbi:helix-turn-helix domain-containing protein [Brevundimonas sp. SORGH_AS_0993]|uniref:helix-turn-helix domain-containing protein n=1 Tax=Brevundimonas sp. SORGH_AS_0993 TaxID=3041794 RepID=UPI0027802F5E|nr:helix-turn-helix transcriptional regulator [Brevundimonas sp. SORGH_AS_0993]MDQ1155019.1 transcriptional regulator with XRE-family HTH domain [Brevundimonas sp. SORGH_AS_0993]
MDKPSAPPPRTPRSVDAVDVAVGERIAARRIALGLSQTALADRIGVSCQQVQKYEGGRNRISAARLHSLALALDLPISAFFPVEAGAVETGEVSVMRALAATPEGRSLALGFSRIQDHAVRQALSRLVSALAAA